MLVASFYSLISDLNLIHSPLKMSGNRYVGAVDDESNSILITSQEILPFDFRDLLTVDRMEKKLFRPTLKMLSLSEGRERLMQ